MAGVVIACVVVSDRGDLYLPDCLQSLDNVQGFDALHVVDDQRHKLGLAGAVRTGWEWALDRDADYLFWCEEDFRFPQPVRLPDLQYVLERNPHLAQVVLKRQPWSVEEKAAGGIVEMHPWMYVESVAFGRNLRWSEHHRIFSLNPCLIPRRILELGWPDGNEAEFTVRCIEAGYRFAFLGGKSDPPIVEHVGAVRAQGWRL